MDIPGLIRYDNVEELYDELPAEELFLVLRDEMRATKEDFKGHHSEIKAIKRDVRQLRRTVKSLRNSNTSWGSPCILEYGKGGNIERREKSDGDSSPHWYEDLDEDDDSFLDNSFLRVEDSLLDLTLQCTDDERERSKGKRNNYRKRLDFGENVEIPFSHNDRHSSLATLNQSQQPEPDSVLSTHKQETLERKFYIPPI
ncbi:uncharacterized protein [Ptychodera flava]|uniref:uncharacterized protein n=1 Tax=Ptychodera flava TaxID=63121 RepID=UPI00396A982B